MFTGKRLMQVAAMFAVLAALAAGCGGGSDGESASTTDVQTTTSEQTTETTPPTTGEEPPPGPTVVRVDIVDGAPQGGIVRETVEKGDRVLIVVTSDVADDVHLHGYDISRDVTAGGTVRMRFRATLAGRFEVELEDRGIPIADLTVKP